MSSFSLPATGATTQLVLSTQLPEEYAALVVPVFEGEEGLEFAVPELFDEPTALAIWELLNSVGAQGKANEITRVPAVEGLNCDFVVGVGLGDNENLDSDVLRNATGCAARSLTDIDTVVTTLNTFDLTAAVEGFGLGAYNYTGLKTKPGSQPVKKVIFFAEGETAEKEFAHAKTVVEAVVTARDLVNAPSSHLYPESYAEIMRGLGKAVGVQVDVLDEHALKEQGFGGILAVGMGSARKPRLVRMSWQPDNATQHVALVGKGITFDTGGISLKPGANMDNMISDMGGSAAVVATVVAAAKLNLPIQITATIPLAENMPDGSSYRPGDVITHYGGITSEILNTDAEGRIILSDAIARASEDKPDYLLEVATLTGAQIVALGDRTSGVMGSDDFRDVVARTGMEVGEPAWAMPIPEDIAEAMKSPVADLRNVSHSRSGGMLAAAAYLREFVGDDIQWAHVDIAGPSYNTASPYGFTPKRATGVPVRTFIKVLEALTIQEKA
ncbi:leucyl aminopeptidase [Corynebacterium kutscheri]|uniref:Probable cytosol aminopeptidase n=1 Tax=Corynebacterium kutscheri TaxID=35755 RepID=A0AB38VUP6_9CORY|nr:leucyl aminopeptidase [Corynebacterium kutscheri]VEH08884.1 leucyl aminopeptidase [Corynebacterium kutscheri]VEH80013.1 leucyl aminopeptidase [Corynebacterium kutscheri]